MQKFANFSNFRYRLIFAILSGKKIAFALNKNSRLNLHQNTFLDLCKKICNDFYTDIDKNYLVINPGTIVNGTDIEFDCGYEKPIGYFIEGILVLALFGKNDLKITFAGKTSSFGNISVDFAKNLVETLKHFGANNCVLEIKKRGSCKEMPAEISLIVSVVKSLKQVNLVDSGHVEKIRGIAFCEMVPPAIANRMSITAKKILKDFLPDVWIFTEAFNRKILINKEDKNFGICLTAESSTGSLLSGEECLHDSLSPEEVAERATKFVLKEISHGGFFDEKTQPFVILLMVLCREDVSNVKFGKLSNKAIQCLRDIKTFFGVIFKISEEDKNVTLSCRGVGYSNLQRAWD